jgi:multiple sugar transport system permease protein
LPPIQGRVLAWTLLAIGGIVMMTPLAYMVATSLKLSSEFTTSTSSRASRRSRTFIFIFKNTRFGLWFLNSLITSALVTVSVLFFDSLIGYTLAKFTFAGAASCSSRSDHADDTDRDACGAWYIMAKNFGWLNSYWGIMFPGMMTGFGVF